MTNNIRIIDAIDAQTASLKEMYDGLPAEDKVAIAFANIELSDAERANLAAVYASTRDAANERAVSSLKTLATELTPPSEE